MICRNCKKVIPNGSELCPECGARQTSGSSKAAGDSFTAQTSSYNYGKANSGGQPERGEYSYGKAGSVQAPAGKKKSGGKGCLIAIAVFIVIILVITAGSLIFINRVKKRIEPWGNVVQQIQEMIESGDYQEAIEELEGLQGGEYDDEEIRKMLQDIYEKWFSEKMEDGDLSMEEMMEMIEDMSHDMPGNYEDIQEMMEKIKEKVKEQSEEQEIVIPDGFWDSFDLPEGFSEDFQDMFNDIFEQIR